MNDINRYESAEEALMFVIRRSNKEIKEVATALWPSDPPMRATARLTEALNQKHKLTLDEYIFIMNFCGHYDIQNYISDRTGHHRPTKKIIQVEQQQIKEKFEEMIAAAMKSYQQIVAMTNENEAIEKVRQGALNLIDFEKAVNSR